MMNSKEKIKNIKSVINEFYHTEKCEGRLTECANDCWKSYQKDCDEIEQDLDRLKKLEKEHQKLKKIFKKRAELCSEFSEYTRQYEKALDFLMDKFKLELKGNRLYFLYNNQYFELNKEEEKLLKEVFGNE